MLSYEAYKLAHVLGILLLFGAIGGSVAARSARPQGVDAARPYTILHGVALGLMLVAGFGILAKLGMGSPATWGLWVWIKLVVWLLLGASLVAVKKIEARVGLVVALALLGAIAAWAALFKPGA